MITSAVVWTENILVRSYTMYYIIFTNQLEVSTTYLQQFRMADTLVNPSFTLFYF